MKKTLLTTLALTIASASGIAAYAQDSLSVSAGADLVSRYVWRGMDQCSGVSLQPSLGLTYKGFTLSAWGSCSVADIDVEEFDISLSYTIGNFSIGVTDYFWQGASASYGHYTDDHFYELNLGYTVSEKVPLTLSWNTMFLAGKSAEYDEDGDRMYSSYFNIGYAFDVHGIELSPAIGINPWKSQYDDEFSIMDITLTASKDIKITESFTLPIFAQVIASPATDKARLVFGVSF